VNVAIGVRARDRVGELAGHVLVDRVQPIGSIQRDRGDALRYAVCDALHLPPKVTKGTPRELILDTLAVITADGLTTASLLEACAVMRFKSVASRVALTRLQAAGLIESPERSFWRLTRKSPWSRDVERWRTIKSRTKPWDQTWIAVLASAVPRSQRTERGHTERALRHRGFRELRRDVFMRPANLRASLIEIVQDLLGLGASSSIDALVVSELGFAPALGPWRIAEHQARVAAARARMTALLEHPPRDPAEACRAFWHAGRDVLRLVNADPLLPDELADAESRRELLDRLPEFVVRGRDAWIDLLGLPRIR
jgi:phenylacetic acid degradation operon negative regulatory protein